MKASASLHVSRQAAIGVLALVVGACCWSQGAPSATPAARPAAATRVSLGGPEWTALTPAQRQTLAPLEQDWPSIEPSRKAKWLELAARFSGMTPDDRQRVQQRMAEWARLTPAERGRARLSFQEAKQLSPEEKQARWDAYQALPADQRQALAQRGKRTSDKPAAASAPSPSIVVAQPKQTAPLAASAAGPLVKPVAPTIVQAKPGATTTLMTRSNPPPIQHQPGQPKIAAKPSDVDRITMLPRSGPQAVAPASATQP